MEYALILGLLILLYALLKFFRKAAERRRELYIRSLRAPVGGDGVSRFVCVHRTDGSSASYFRTGVEEQEKANGKT
jgi:hypothetical protein